VGVLALAHVVDDVQMQRRCVVGQFDEIGTARMRRCGVEQIDQRHAREHPAAAIGTRGDGRCLEPAGEQEQALALARVEHDLFPVLIHDHEPGGHASTVAPDPAPPHSPLGCWLVRAITIVDGRLEPAERTLPEPEPNGVVVRVHGAGLNRADLLQRAGFYPAPPGVPADIPGMEFAGVISAVGRDVTERAVGERVFGITGGGAQAQYLAVPAVHCALVPEHLDLVAMGGVPEVFVTVHDAMVTQAHVAPGEWVLVHAIGSGVGTAALQLAHELGAHVVGTARTGDKLERCRALGLDAGIPPALTADGALDVDALARAIVEATGGGAHVTLDLVGGDYVVADINAATPKGRIVLIGTIAGGRATVPIMGILGKRLTVMGTVLRGRDIAEKAAAMDAFVRDVVPMLADGRVAPIVEETFPLERANDAYALLESDATFGKVILDCR
jgi:NADPH2:quinone reductase